MAMPPEIDEMAATLAARFQPIRIVLFGSYARGEATFDSDVDLLVVIPAGKSLREAAVAMDKALSNRSLPLDLVVLTPEQFDNQVQIPGTIASEALREGRVLYDHAA